MTQANPDSLCRRHFHLEVKGQALEHPNPRIPVSELRTLDQARRVVERVEADARTVLEKADQDADKIREQARAETSHQVLREAEGLLRQLGEMNRVRQQTVADYAAEVAARALERLAGEIPQAQRIQAVVNELLAQAGKERDGILLVHPDDQPHLPEALRQSPWSLGTSDRVPPGSCLLNTPHGSYETSFQVRLETLIGRVRGGTTSTASQTANQEGNPADPEATHSGTQEPDGEG